MAAHSPSTPDPASVTALAAAITAGDVACVDALLGDDPTLARAILPNGHSMLHVATDWPGHQPNVAETIRLLVAAGADPMARFEHPNGTAAETPLHWAASSDDTEAVGALLDAGADIEATGGVIGDCAPFEEAIIFEQYAAAALLLERGATAYLPGVAALGRLDMVVEYFDEHGELVDDSAVPPNWLAIPGATALIDLAFQFACRAGHLEVAHFLLWHGANVDAETPMSTTARHEAAENGHDHVTSWLDQL
jgi:ankyrin repeat protein